ncbi:MULTISPECIES: substrate-binding domain-containing protein [unclassified Ruminococcus]|uniref:sugar ABC transporter substrate-binding protein n=1 Tax=unclassified Ruminococcus TaxID=2608920 RepID=UPI00319DEBA2
MKRKVAMAMVAAMAVGSLAVPVMAEDGAEGGKIGISMPTQSLERWNRDGSYLQKQFEDAGYEVELTYSDNETDRQVNDIQNLISDGVNLLVVAAIDGEALNTVMDEAADAGIPVISYDRLIKSDAVSYYISFDNYTVGTLQGQYVVDTLDLDNAGDKTYNIEFTAGDPADNNAGYFFNGAFDVLKPYIDAGTLNVVSGQTDFDSVASQAVKVLSENRLAGKVAVVAQDADLAACQRIVEGTQEMTVYKPIELEANTAAEFAVALGKGEDITSGEGEYKAVETFNDGTYDIPYYKIDPIAVTAENMDKVIIDGGFHTREDVYLNIR